jgi:hypothetical protein
MVIVSTDDLRTAVPYLKMYLKWVSSYADDVPDGLFQKGEFGVLRDNGWLRIVVPLVDGDGAWVATGMGPECRPEWWTIPGGKAQ